MPIFFLHMRSTSFLFLCALALFVGQTKAKIDRSFRLANCCQLLLNVIYTIFMLFCSFVRCVSLLSAARFGLHFAHFNWHDIHNGPLCWASSAASPCLGGFLTQYTINIFNCRQFSWQTLHKLRDRCQVTGTLCASSFPKSFRLPSSFPKSFASPSNVVNENRTMH